MFKALTMICRNGHVIGIVFYDEDKRNEDAARGALAFAFQQIGGKCGECGATDGIFEAREKAFDDLHEMIAEAAPGFDFPKDKDITVVMRSPDELRRYFTAKMTIKDFPDTSHN